MRTDGFFLDAEQQSPTVQSSQQYLSSMGSQSLFVFPSYQHILEPLLPNNANLLLTLPATLDLSEPQVIDPDSLVVNLKPNGQ